MNLRPAQDELAQLAEFQRRHRVSLLCVVCLELAGVAKLKQQLGDAVAVRLLRQHEQVLRDLLAGFRAAWMSAPATGRPFWSLRRLRTR